MLRREVRPTVHVKDGVETLSQPNAVNGLEGPSQAEGLAEPPPRALDIEITSL